MAIEIPRPVLKGAKALVVGVANQYSIAYGCAKAFRELGADLAITYINEKTKTYVEPLTLPYLTEIIRREQPDALLSTVGGQTGLNLSVELAEAGVLEKKLLNCVG